MAEGVESHQRAETGKNVGDGHRAERWLISGDLPCLMDGYNLRGLVGPVVRCPECGGLNDLRDPAPWRKQDLELGVKQREHWPAGSAFIAFVLAVITYALGGAIWERGWFNELIIPLGVFTAGVGLWVWQLRKFIRSARAIGWAVVVLTATHAGTLLTLLGLVSSMYLVATQFDPSAQDERWIAWAFAGLTPVGFGLFAWVKWTLRAHDNAESFRVDWQRYSLPVEVLDGETT